MKLDISHLVVNGCSYTYGHGIWDPINDAWPSLIAKRLGVPLVNLALPGFGNDTVQRRTYDYFFQDLHYDNNPFYIHAYSQSQRREVYLTKDYLGHSYQDYRLVDASDTGKLSRLEKEIILETDDYCLKLLEQNKLRIWHSINGLLDSHKINHFSTDYMPDTNGDTIDWISKHHFILKAALDSHPSRLTDFSEVTQDISKTPCLHETEEGHIKVADYVYNQITKRYSEINVVDKPHAKLKDIYIEPPSIIEERKRNHNLKLHQYLHREWGANIYYLTELGYDWTQINWLGRPEPGIKP